METGFYRLLWALFFWLTGAVSKMGAGFVAAIYVAWRNDATPATLIIVT